MIINFKFVFDKEVCTVDDDETLVKIISRQKKSHFQTKFGSSIICSPSAAPEDKKKDEIRLLKLNQVDFFIILLKYFIKSN